MTTISLQFEDFKSLADNHRVYYFVGDGYYDFIYLVDGIIVKTTLANSQIDNPKQFFSDKLFYGAVRLTFPVGDSNQDFFSKVAGLKQEVDLSFDVRDVQDEEVKNEDIQKEGISSEEEHK